MLEKIIWIILSVSFMIFLIFFSIFLFPKTEKNIEKISGRKDYVSFFIASKLYECWKKNIGKQENTICYIFRFESREEIFKSDIEERLRGYDVDIGNFEIPPTIGKEGNLVIKFQDNKIILEILEHERIGS